MRLSRLSLALVVVSGLVLAGALVRCKQEGHPPSTQSLPKPIAPEVWDGAVSSEAGAGAKPHRSPGCTNHPARPRAVGETRHLAERTFHVWTPAGFDPGRAYPVVLALHGWGSNGRGLQKWFLMEEHVANEAIVVYPDSKGSTWDFVGDHEFSFFEAMVADLSEAFCIDPSRIFVFGYSFGGRMAHHLGCHRASLFRAIAVGGSDWWTRERVTCGRVPVMVNHRTHDNSMLIAGARTSVAKWAGVNGCSEAEEITDVRMGCRAYKGCDAPVVFCEDTHFDSAWPSSWNHTVRKEYRDLTWRWFTALP